MIFNALSSHHVDAEVGACYRRLAPGSVEEIAQVLEIAPDKMGIPHVRFKLRVMRGSSRPTEEYRTLALEVFQTRYRERLED